MARLISRSELARLAKVSPAAITKACKAQLAPACVGKRVDLDHRATKKYLASKGASPPAPTAPPDPPTKAPAAPTTERRTSKKGPAPEPADRRRPARKQKLPEPGELDAELSADDVEDLLGLTLRDILERFGTKTAFKDWLVAVKTIADIREKELKSDETEGRLIDRELVKTHVFGAIEAGNRRLLGDSPKTIARRLYALAKSGAPVEEAEKVVREIISSQLKPVKTTAARVLRNA